MSFRVLVSRAASAQLDSLPLDAYRVVHERLGRLSADPRPAGCVKLEHGLWRIRIGDYRAIYTVDDAAGTVVLLRVARRSEKTYRRLPPL